MPKPSKPRMFMVLGVDVGVEGGLSLVDEDGEVRLYCKTPDTVENIDRFIKVVKREAKTRPVFAVVERLTPMFRVSKTTAFSMGRSLGVMVASIVCNGIPCTIVGAKEWQKPLKLPPRKQKDYNKHKERLRNLAQKKFPELEGLWSGPKNMQKAVCDSLLIADYGRSLYLG